jgi:transcriptional regulator with XRE-family HTH domain
MCCGTKENSESEIVHLRMATEKLFTGRKVREVRLASKVTQIQFAERLGISTSSLNQIESNQRPVSASSLVALGDKFKLISPNWRAVERTVCSRLFQRPSLIPCLKPAPRDPATRASRSSLRALTAQETF